MKCFLKRDPVPCYGVLNVFERFMAAQTFMINVSTPLVNENIAGKSKSKSGSLSRPERLWSANEKLR